MLRRRWLGVPWLFLLPVLGHNVSAWQPCAHLSDPEIDECSGIVSSRRYPGVYWVHNDSGDLPRLFAIGRDGALLREVRLSGARNEDWEDITTDDAGHLYIGDFGNNRNKRQDLLVYVIDEPDPRAPGAPVLNVPVLQQRPFRFPEQRAFPDPDEMNYDCEALFWDAGSLYVLTKHRSDARTVLYRLPRPGDTNAVRLGEREIGSQVTAAALSRDGGTLAVLSYQYIDLFQRPKTGENFLSGPSERILIEGRQCESIDFDGDSLLFTNEQREIYCVAVTDLRRLGRFLPAPPRSSLRRLPLARDGTAASWAGAEALVLAPEPAEPAGTGLPEVRLGWCPTGLLLRVRWPVPAGASVADGALLQLMYGPRGAPEPALQPGQRVVEGVWAGTGLTLRPVLPSPGAALSGAVLRRTGTELCLDVRVPAVLAAGETLLVNVIVRDAAKKSRAWSWAGSPSTEPLQNPLLWGLVELTP